MLRPFLVSMVMLSVASAASAALSSARQACDSLADRLSLERTAQLIGQLEQTTSARQQERFVITEETEIQLDGLPCKYAQVPQGAAIVLLEVATDGRTVLKVHFRTTR